MGAGMAMKRFRTGFCTLGGALLALFTIGPVQAASCTWSGGTDLNWTTAANWSCSAVPGPSDSVTINGASVNLSGSGTKSVQSLSLSSAALVIDNAITLNVANLYMSQGVISAATTPSSSRPTLNASAVTGTWGNGAYAFNYVNVNMTAPVTGLADLSAGTITLLGANFTLNAGSALKVGAIHIAKDSPTSPSASFVNNANLSVGSAIIGDPVNNAGFINGANGVLDFYPTSVVTESIAGPPVVAKRSANVALHRHRPVIAEKTLMSCEITIVAPFENRGAFKVSDSTCEVGIAYPTLFSQTNSNASTSGNGCIFFGDAGPSNEIHFATGYVSGNLEFEFATFYNDGATITPGGAGAIGTIWIDGDYVAGRNAALTTEFYFDGEGIGNDYLSVDGDVSLDGRLNVAYLSSSTSFGNELIAESPLTIVESYGEGGIAGDFATKSYPSTYGIMFSPEGSEYNLTFSAGSSNTRPSVSVQTAGAAFAGVAAAVTVTIQNTSSAAALTGVSFVLSLPSGLSVAGTSSQSTCTGGSVSAIATSITANGMSIAAGSSCQVSFSVTGSAGTYQITLLAGALSSSAGSNTNDATALLTFRVPPQPKISLSPAALVFDQQTIGTRSDAKSFAVNSVGDGPLAISTIVGSGEFSFSTDCPQGGQLDPGTSCSVTVNYNPLTVGVVSGSISVFSNAAAGSGVESLSGEGVAIPVPNVLVSPSAIVFADTNVDETSASSNVTVTNSGQATLKISSISVSGAFTLNNGCGSTLAPKASCSLSAAFKPTAVGPQLGQITINHNAKSGSNVIALSGSAKPAQHALIQLTGGGDLGNITIGNISDPVNVSIGNTGNIPLVISGLSFTGANASEFSISGGCTTVAPQGSCSVTVRFAPLTTGSKSALFAVSSNAHNSPVATTGFSGTGVPRPAPIVTLSATSLGFGNVIYGGTPAAQSITLTNTGNATLLIGSIVETGNSDFSISQNCGASLAANASCNIGVSFSPHAIGARSGSLTVRSNANGSPNMVQLSGTGCRYFSPAAARFFLTSC
jgi:hypothetical protein